MNTATASADAPDFSEELAQALADVIPRIAAAVGEDAAAVFSQIMRRNLASVLTRRADGSLFVITGDIPAMWLRDSSTQLRPYLLLSDNAPVLQDVLHEIARTQFSLLRTDPYANSFRDEESTPTPHVHDIAETGPLTWERKFELDSLSFPIELVHRLWRRTGRTDLFDDAFLEAARIILDVVEVEQDHDQRSTYSFERPHVPGSETLVRDGRGRRTRPCGLVWSAFRPSDDACQLGFNVPGNMFLAVCLDLLAEITEEAVDAPAIAARARALAASIRTAVTEVALVDTDLHGRIFAYEVDGAGRALFLDDANMPSLLSAPLSGYIDITDPDYVRTRDFALSAANPNYACGEHAAGIGSQHTPHGYVWPIALAVEALTTSDAQRKREIARTLLATTAGTGNMHESFDPDHPEDFTRPWFSWADAMFCELVLDIVDVRH